MPKRFFTWGMELSPKAKDNQKCFQLKRPLNIEQFVKANNEIIERYLAKIEEQRKKNPIQAALTEKELEAWEQQVNFTLIEPILESFRQAKSKSKKNGE